MKMRKWMSALLATSMVAGLALTGCGNGGNSSSNQTSGETNAAGEEVANKIVIFQSKVEIADQLEDCAKAFQEETGIEVEIWGTTGDDYMTQLKTKLANNQGPTIFSCAGDSELEDIKGYCLDVSDIGWIDQIADGMLDSITGEDGGIYGIPYTVEGFGIVYNKDLTDATKFTSIQDLEDEIKAQEANGINGFELSQETYFLIGHILNTPFALQDDPDAFVDQVAAGEVKMADNEIFQEFADFLVFLRENCQNPLEQNYDGEIGDLATGKAAMIHQGNWAGTLFEDDYEFTDVGLAPFPLAGNDCVAVAVPNFWTISTQATEAEQNAAKEFLTWLYTSETGKSYLYDEFKFIPLIDGDESDALDVLSADVAKYVADGKTIGWPNKKWPANSVDVYFAPLAEEFFTTDMSADEFLQKLDSTYAEAVANQG